MLATSITSQLATEHRNDLIRSAARWRVQRDARIARRVTRDDARRNARIARRVTRDGASRADRHDTRPAAAAAAAPLTVPADWNTDDRVAARH